MSAISLIPLLAAAIATALGCLALHTVRGLRTQVAALRAQLDAAAHPAAPAARSASAEDIRTAVVDALAEERERELAEARAFWAAQEARDAVFDVPLSESHGREYEISLIDAALLDALLDGDPDGTHPGQPAVPRQPGPDDIGTARPDRPTVNGGEIESAELAAARRRHPSHPDFSPGGDADAAWRGVGGLSLFPADDERTFERLAELAAARTPLADVRPGPQGTLDVYVFVDGTTLCMSPGQRETTDRLAGALASGDTPALLGGSAVSGAYTLTFACGEESVYVLADRVIASF